METRAPTGHLYPGAICRGLPTGSGLNLLYPEYILKYRKNKRPVTKGHMVKFVQPLSGWGLSFYYDGNESVYVNLNERPDVANLGCLGEKSVKLVKGVLQRLKCLDSPDLVIKQIMDGR